MPTMAYINLLDLVYNAHIIIALLHTLVHSKVQANIVRLIIRDVNPVLTTKKTGSGLCTSNIQRILKFYEMNVLDNFISILFCFHTFVVRRSIDVLDSANQPGSDSFNADPDPGLQGLQRTSDIISMKTKRRF